MADYTVQTPNGDLKISVPGGWATEETLKSLKSIFEKTDKGLGKAFKDISKEFDKNNKRGITNQVSNAAEGFEELNDELTKTERGMRALQFSLKTAGDIAAGVLQGTGRLTDVVPLIDTVASGFKKFLSVVDDIEILGVSLGGVGEAMTELAQKMMELTITVGQQLIDAFEILTAQGIQTTESFEGLQSDLAGAKIGLEAFTEAIKNNSGGLVSLGGDLETGAKRFLQITTIANTQMREQFRALGMSTTEVGTFIADFVDSQRLGILQNKIGNIELLNTALDLNKELKVLAELTGQDVDALRDKILSENAATGALNTIARLDREFGSDAGVYTAFKLLRDGVPDAVAPVIDQLVKFDAAIGEQAPLNAFPGLVAKMNTAVDTILSNPSLDSAERRALATRFVDEIQNEMANIIKSGQNLEIGEYAGLGVNETADFIGNITKEAGKKYALQLERDFEDTGSYVDVLRAQQEEMLESIKNTNSTIGNLNQSVIKIEDARSNFEAGLLSAAEAVLPSVATAITGFYSLLGAAVDIDVKGMNMTPTEGSSVIPKDENGLPKVNPRFRQVNKKFFGGGLFPGMTALIGEAGPELVQMGNSFGEVMNSKDTQSLFGDMKGMMDSIMPALQSGDISGVMNQMETMRPQLESTMKTVGGEIESKVGESPAMANLQSTMSKANMDFQKESVNYAAQNQQTLIKIEKLLKNILPKALSGNGYF
jgi:hypothetical protein